LVRLERLCFAIIVLAGVAPFASRAQTPAASNISAPPSACWRFAFGQWTPALDWSRAGHPGEIGATASAVQRIRDSVFARDPVATSNNAMTWERTPDGMLLMLYPPWWPVGVKVTFDSTTADGKEMVGTAVALQANADQTPSHSRARARQVACSPRSP
jgi:hypothetical protein